MSTIKLPPLPDPHCGPNYHTDGLALFSDDQMQAYATKAVEAALVAAKEREACAQVCGDSAFESWYSTYSPVHKSDKQRARDAYAAGMGDPLVTASRGKTLRLLTQEEMDSLGRRAEGMDGNEWDQWVQEKFAQVNGLKVQGGSYEWY